ncbi:MAG: 50S ribosomal protein L6 [Patescibacteria group bacterium]
MSRVGKQPIQIPSGVTITATDDNISVTGPKGTLEQFGLEGIKVSQEGEEVHVSRTSDVKEHRSRHGLMRTLIANMVQGVTEGFEKKLELNGVGFRVNVSGKTLTLTVGFSHDIEYKIPEDVDVSIEDNNIIVVTGINKQRVGQIAAEIRSFKKPEPYKGKGIKYIDEHIIRKAGKSGGEGAA